MQRLDNTAAAELADVRYVLSDLDDTLTLDGRLPAASYAALEQLEAAGCRVVIVSGRPAGWCDMIARMWPVAAVVGENGAFSFRYDRAARRMIREFQFSDTERARDQTKLAALFAAIKAKYPQAQLSADQAYRISDYAIDFCEDVEPLSRTIIDDMVAMLEAGGATVKISSIHINTWFGDFSKQQMSRRLLTEGFGERQGDLQKLVVYSGDSPNDGPMFEHFRLSVGVANIVPFLKEMPHHPRWLTGAPGGHGFCELAELLLARPAALRP